MMTTTSPDVLAGVNAKAVLGALPTLAEIVPEAQKILAAVRHDTTLTLAVRGGPTVHYRFSADDIALAEQRPRFAAGPVLGFVSPEHFNSVLAGSSAPIPLATPAGLKFLKNVFTPLTELLTRYLQPSDDDLTDPAFARSSTILTLAVAVGAIAEVGNNDPSGKLSAAHMPDGTLALEAGDDVAFRVRVVDHVIAVEHDFDEPARATLRFADLEVAGDLLAGRTSAISCLCDGRIAMSGFIPLVDNTNRILDRVGNYLGA